MKANYDKEGFADDSYGSGKCHSFMELEESLDQTVEDKNSDLGDTEEAWDGGFGQGAVGHKLQ